MNIIAITILFILIMIIGNQTNNPEGQTDSKECANDKGCSYRGDCESQNCNCSAGTMGSKCQAEIPKCYPGGGFGQIAHLNEQIDFTVTLPNSKTMFFNYGPQPTGGQYKYPYTGGGPILYYNINDALPGYNGGAHGRLSSGTIFTIGTNQTLPGNYMLHIYMGQTDSFTVGGISVNGIGLTTPGNLKQMVGSRQLYGKEYKVYLPDPSTISISVTTSKAFHLIGIFLYPECSLQGTCSQSSEYGTCTCTDAIGEYCEIKCVNGTYHYTDPSTCEPCDCNWYGTESCGYYTGTCTCKDGYGGVKCDSCLTNYYLSGGNATNPICSECECIPAGTALCDGSSGACDCLAGYTGNHCGECDASYYIAAGSENNPDIQCDSCSTICHASQTTGCTKTGECICNPGHANRYCTSCASNAYPTSGTNGTTSLVCELCGCWEEGSEHDGCDQATGQCVCEDDYAGIDCNQCRTNRYVLNGTEGVDPICKHCSCAHHGSPSQNCNSHGKCDCNAGYEGDKCTSCVEGRYPLGTEGDRYVFCIFCNCHALNSLNASCNTVGECYCNVTSYGDKCTQCNDGYKKIGGGECVPCTCQTEGSINNVCDKVTGECQCKTGYTGYHCTDCTPNYYKTAVDDEACIECPCNPIGTENCTYIGGNCQCHANYTSPNCETCVDGYHAIAGTPGVNPTCTSCDCYGAYAINASCDHFTGQCHCKENAVGEKCDACSTSSYPVGATCQPCLCNPNGVGSPSCNNGTCTCLTGYSGEKCDQCHSNRYVSNGDYAHPTCTLCGCAVASSHNSTCLDGSGQCYCNDGHYGLKCEYCKLTYYANSGSNGTNPLTCTPCGCFSNGSSSGVCNPSGECQCNPGYEDDKCNSCASNYYCSSGTQGVNPTCDDCLCYNPGSITQSCADYTGDCNCETGYRGKKCNYCYSDYYASTGNQGVDPSCQSCNCYKLGSSNVSCTNVDGLCFCNEGYEGTKCNECINTYYSKNASQTVAPDCEACVCNMNGSYFENCTEVSGNCYCKEGYESSKCNICSSTYYALHGTSGVTPVECTDCNCWINGSTSLACNVASGNCDCLVGHEGRMCRQCSENYFISSGISHVNVTCQDCACFAGGSLSAECDDYTGQCYCHANYTGLKCNQCIQNYFADTGTDLVDPLCVDCNCSVDGSANLECLDGHGNCTCKSGYTGLKCELYMCFNISFNDPNVCSAHGECLAINYCKCDDWWGGLDCRTPIVEEYLCEDKVYPMHSNCFNLQPIDPQVCRIAGECVGNNTCNCEEGRYGADCRFTTKTFVEPFSKLVSTDISGPLVRNRCQHVFVASPFHHVLHMVYPARYLAIHLFGQRDARGLVLAKGKYARFADMTAMVIDSHGHLLVVNGRQFIQHVNTQNRTVSLFAGNATSSIHQGSSLDVTFSYIHSMTMSDFDELYISDKYCIKRIGKNKQVVLEFGSTTNAGNQNLPGVSSRFNNITSIVIDNDHLRLYTLEGITQRIRRLDLITKDVSVVIDTNGGHIDGACNLAKLDKPIQLLFEPIDHSLFFLDQSYVIRKLSLHPTCIVSTIYGKTSVAPYSVDSEEGVQHALYNAISMESQYKNGSQEFFVSRYDEQSKNGSMIRIQIDLGSTQACNASNDLSCSNHGECIASTGKCQCTTGYYGDQCGIFKECTSILIRTLGKERGFSDSDSDIRWRSPYSLSSDGNKNIYVADTMNHRIRRVTHFNMVNTIAGTVDGDLDHRWNETLLSYPVSIVNIDNHVLFTKELNGHLRAFFYNTMQSQTMLHHDDPGPSHMVTVEFHNQLLLAISSTTTHRIKFYRVYTNYITVNSSVPIATTRGYQDGDQHTGMLDSPRGISFNATSATLFVADTGNNLVRSVFNGTLSTALGIKDQKMIQDGPFSSASFARVLSVEVVNHYLYIIDHTSIRKANFITQMVSTLVSSEGRGVHSYTFSHPTDLIAIDNRLIITDFGASQLVEITFGMDDSCSCESFGLGYHESCNCPSDRYGDKCEFSDYSCNGISILNPHVCSGHGKCVSVDNCECDDQFNGGSCMKSKCTQATNFNKTIGGSTGFNDNPMRFNNIGYTTSYLNGFLIVDQDQSMIRYYEYDQLSTFSGTPIKSYVNGNRLAARYQQIHSLVVCDDKIFVHDDHRIRKIENDTVTLYADLSTYSVIGDLSCDANQHLYMLSTSQQFLKIQNGTVHVNNITIANVTNLEVSHNRMFVVQNHSKVYELSLDGLTIKQHVLGTNVSSLFSYYAPLNLIYPIELFKGSDLGLFVVGGGIINVIDTYNLNLMGIFSISQVASVSHNRKMEQFLISYENIDMLKLYSWKQRVECHCNDSWTPFSTCGCEPSWEGEKCHIYGATHYCFEKFNNEPSVCSGHGICTATDTCNCTTPELYTSYNCHVPVCFEHKATDNGVCSGNGECIAPNTCKCNFGKSMPKCEPCPEGTYLNGTNCTECPKGTYSASIGAVSNSTCLLCPPNKYTDYPGMKLCNSCPVGTWHIVPKHGSTTKDECQACELGYYTTYGSACIACPVGSYSNTPFASLSDCVSCPKGTYGILEAQTNDSACIKCPIGTYSGTKGASGINSCHTCVRGDYIKTNLSGLITRSETCEECPIGFYSNTPGMGIGSCIACPLGTYHQQSTKSCELCPADSYNDMMNSTECKSCPTGFGTPKLGSISIHDCLICSLGSYSSGLGCSKCPVGTYSTTPLARNSSVCIPCPTGQYNMESGLTFCENCEEGKYSIAGVACKNCPAGNFSNAINSIECPACSPGYYSSEGEITCHPCPKGTYSPTSAKFLSGCLTCPPFSVSHIGKAKCTNCSLGQYTSPDLSGCVDCPTGYYSEIEIDSIDKCLMCPVGTYSPISGSNSSMNCIKCPIGFFGFKNGSNSFTQCKRCPPGTFNAKAGGAHITSCSLCPIGYYSQSYGSASCVPCPSNTSCPYMGSSAVLPLLEIVEVDSRRKNKTIYEKDIFYRQLLSIFNPEYSLYELSLTNIILSSSSVVIIFLVILSIIGVLLVFSCWIYGRGKFTSILRHFDLFFSMEHDIELHEQLVKRKTVIGGILSIIVLGSLILFSIITFSQLWFDNINVEESFKPVTSIPPAYTFTHYGDYDMSVRVIGTFENCPDFARNITSIGFGEHPTSNSTNLESTCKHDLHYYQDSTRYNVSNCYCSLKCKNCYIDHANPQVEIFMPDVQSSTILWSLSVPHFIEGDSYIINGSLSSDAGTVFYGTNPTELFFTLYTTLYIPQERFWGPIKDFVQEFFTQEAPKELILKGKQLELIATSLSSDMVSNKELIESRNYEENKSGIHLKYSVRVSDFLFHMEEMLKLTVLGAFAQIGSLTGLVLAILTIAMGFLELVQEKYQGYKASSKIIREDKESNRPEWIERDDYDEKKYIEKPSLNFEQFDDRANKKEPSTKKLSIFTKFKKPKVDPKQPSFLTPETSRTSTPIPWFDNVVQTSAPVPSSSPVPFMEASTTTNNQPHYEDHSLDYTESDDDSFDEDSFNIDVSDEK